MQRSRRSRHGAQFLEVQVFEMRLMGSLVRGIVRIRGVAAAAGRVIAPLGCRQRCRHLSVGCLSRRTRRGRVDGGCTCLLLLQLVRQCVRGQHVSGHGQAACGAHRPVVAGRLRGALVRKVRVDVRLQLCAWARRCLRAGGISGGWPAAAAAGGGGSGDGAGPPEVRAHCPEHPRGSPMTLSKRLPHKGHPPDMARPISEPAAAGRLQQWATPQGAAAK